MPIVLLSALAMWLRPTAYIVVQLVQNKIIIVMIEGSLFPWRCSRGRRSSWRRHIGRPAPSPDPWSSLSCLYPRDPRGRHSGAGETPRSGCDSSGRSAEWWPVCTQEMMMICIMYSVINFGTSSKGATSRLVHNTIMANGEQNIYQKSHIFIIARW